MAPVGQPVADLRQYVRILWSRKWLIAIILVFAGGSTWMWSARQPTLYVAEAEVLVLPLQDPLVSPVPGGANLSPNLETEARIVDSTKVASRVVASLGPAASVDALLRNLEVEPVPNSDILSISYSDQDPDTAAAAADAFADAYVQQRAARAMDVIGEAQAMTTEMITSLRHRIAALTETIAVTADPLQREALQSKLGVLVARLQPLEAYQLDVDAAALGAQGGQIIQDASDHAPRPITTRTRNVVLGVFGGLVLATALAFLIEGLDARVKSREEIEMRLDAPLIGVIPWADGGGEDTIVRADPTNQTSEAYRTLAVNFLQLASARGIRTITVTSALSGEGKTTTAANIAVVLAQAGRSVILVSGDLRRPEIHELFGISNDTGLSNVLSDSAELPDVARSSGIPNLSVIPSGPAPEDPVALLAGDRTAPFLGRLREAADLVIVDAPPILPLADASILASLSDGTVLVVDAERSDREVMAESRKRIEAAGGELIGVVYSNVRSRDRVAISAAYRYTPPPAPSKPPSRKARRGSSGRAASDPGGATTP